MTPQQYLDTYNGQSLLYNTADPSLRGQCVQAVCFYVAANGAPVIWADAYWWKDAAAKYPDKYEWIPNTATAVPQAGDIVIWDRSLANSGGAGHMDVCYRPLPGTGTFMSVAQNWGGKTVHLVTHNYDKVIGWLRIRRPAPAPAAAAPAPQGDEMISTPDQALKVYKMLRPNGQVSDAEVASTAGKRSYNQFVNDAQAEIAARDANLRQQAEQLQAMQGRINQQNQVISDFQVKLQDATLSNEQKQQALDETLATVGRTNAELTAAHDTIKELQDKLAAPAPPAVVSGPVPPIGPDNWLLAWLQRLFKR